MKQVHLEEKWFIDKIGKIIWRNKLSYCCKQCAEVYKNGLKIHDKLHAEYVNEIYNVFNAEGTKVEYFATKKERDEFEGG